MKSKATTTSIKRVLGVIVPIVALVFWWLGMANFLIGRGLMIAYPGVEVTYKGAWFEWDGDVVARDVVIMPFDADDESAIRFQRIHVETPGWFWFVRNLFDRKLKRAHLDRVHVTLEGGSAEWGYDPSMGDLGPVGPASASPFEAEGCLQDAMWLPAELKEMGLSPEPTRLEFDYRVDGPNLETTVVLETPRSSRMRYDRRSRVGSNNALLLDDTPEEVLSERWEVEDQGFVSARNRYCSKKDGIEARRFIERHIAAVERLLATRGIALSADSRTAYRRFARDGGKLAFGGEYSRPLDGAEIYEIHDSEELFVGMAARLEHNARGHAVVLQRFDPAPLPGQEDGAPTYALMQKERVARPAAATSAAPGADASSITAVLPPTGAPVTVPPSAPAAPAPGTDAATAIATTPAATTAEPASPPAPTAGTPASTAGSETAPPAADTMSPTTPPVSTPPSASTPVASTPSTTPAEPTTATAIPATDPGAATAEPAEPPVATAPPAAVPVTPAAAAIKPAGTAVPMDPATAARIKASSLPASTSTRAGPKPGMQLEWSQLPPLRGRIVRIWTMHNPPRTVEILSSEGDTIRVSARIGGGAAEYTIQRQGFLRATLIQ
jgi:hypothetical protein